MVILPFTAAGKVATPCPTVYFVWFIGPLRPCRRLTRPLGFPRAQTISSSGSAPDALHFAPLGATSATALVVEPSPVRGLAADCPLLQHLGFNRMPSHRFFLLSPPSRFPCFTATLWCNGLWGFPAIQREIIAARYRTARLVLCDTQQSWGHSRIANYIATNRSSFSRKASAAESLSVQATTCFPAYQVFP